MALRCQVPAASNFLPGCGRAEGLNEGLSGSRFWDQTINPRPRLRPSCQVIFRRFYYHVLHPLRLLHRNVSLKGSSAVDNNDAVDVQRLAARPVGGR